jgi:hypothetical protein
MLYEMRCEGKETVRQAFSRLASASHSARLQQISQVMASTYHVGQRIAFDSHICTVRYIGPVAGTQKEWLGVEWDDPIRGKHDGDHNGIKYFSCKDFATS